MEDGGALSILIILRTLLAKFGAKMFLLAERGKVRVGPNTENKLVLLTLYADEEYCRIPLTPHEARRAAQMLLEQANSLEGLTEPEGSGE
jgi:hypothetical protein